MAKLRLMIEAEYENIERTIAKLPPSSKLPSLSEIELAGAATFLHNIYNGMENILKQCLLDISLKVPKTES